MNETDILTTIAQLAIGVAGFSGIAIAFNRQPGKLIDVEAYRIAILFANAFAAMFISLLPFPLYYLCDDLETVWRLGSAVIAIFTTFFLNYYLRRTRHSAVFLFGVLWLLFHSTFQFGRILFVQPPPSYVDRLTEHV